MATDPDPRRWVRDLHMPSGLTQMGPGPPHAIRTPADGSGTSTCHPDSRRWVRDLHVPIRTPRELSAQLAAREGSGAATCHAGAGASLPLEAPSPTRIKCEWLRQALLPLGTGQLLSVHTVDR